MLKCNNKLKEKSISLGFKWGVMEEQVLEKYIDYIENFDKKGITVVLQMVTQGAGTLLQESLLNGHENILSIISLLSPQVFYHQFIKDKTDYSLNEAVHLFTQEYFKGSHLPSTENNKIKILYDIDRANTESMKKFKAEFEVILSSIIEKLEAITRRNFFLAVHFAYAHIKNIDISKIKVIYKHHHAPPFEYDADFKKNSFISMSMEDFPSLKVIANIRHFVAATNANYNCYEKCDQLSRLLTHYFLEHYFWVRYYYYIYDILVLESMLKENIKFVKFEDLHLKTEETMRELADFIGIDYHPCLLESAFEGELFYWPGYDGKETPIYGTNPNYNVDKWKDFPLEPHTKLLYAKLFNGISKHFGYEEITDYDEKHFKDIYKISYKEKHLLSRFILNQCMGDYKDLKAKANDTSMTEIVLIVLKDSLKKIFVEKKPAYFFNIISLIKNLKYCFFDYQKTRKKLLKNLLMIANRLDKSKSTDEFVDFYYGRFTTEMKILEEMEFDKYLKKLEKKYKHKSILIYGDSKLFHTICKLYNLSSLNIVGVCDKKFEAQTSTVLNHSYTPIAPNKIDEYEFDVVLIALYNNLDGKFFTFIYDEFLKNKVKIKVDFLYKNGR